MSGLGVGSIDGAGTRWNLWELVQITVLVLAATALCHWSYYLLAPWIWDRNMAFRPADIAPWVLPFTAEHDGIEIYALYLLMFVNIAIAFGLSRWMQPAARSPANLFHAASHAMESLLITAAGAVVAFIFLKAIGFVPPMNSLLNGGLVIGLSRSLAVLIGAAPLVALYVYLRIRSPRWSGALLYLLLAAACFIPANTDPIIALDYSYVFAPALRLLSGAPPNDVYFQYDLLPSLLAAAWMKMGLELNAFPIIGQLAYFVAILWATLLARRLFQDKALALLLLVALIVGRLYTSSTDPLFDPLLCCLQVTPLRLDLWLPLLAVVSWQGAYHWSAGIVCGSLLLLANKFGIIYSLAYLQLLVTLFLLERSDGEARPDILSELRAYARRCAQPIAIILVCWALSIWLLHNNTFGNYAVYYQKIGIGFMTIAPNSFYWYVVALLSIAVILLVRVRGAVSREYLAAGFLLVYCAIGSSVYFFGRSHEQALLNIAIILLTLLFFTLDVWARLSVRRRGMLGLPLSWTRYAQRIAGVTVIGVMLVFYGNNIVHRAWVQMKNVAVGQVTYPFRVDRGHLQDQIATIRRATADSPLVYFLATNDFPFYYYGGYQPIGFVNPFWAWIFIAHLKPYIQDLLDHGYYLVCAPDMAHLPEALALKFDSRQSVQDLVVIARTARPH